MSEFDFEAMRWAVVAESTVLQHGGECTCDSCEGATYAWEIIDDMQREQMLKNRKRSYRAEYASDLALIYGWKCHYCDRPLEYKTCTVDHIHPLNGSDSDTCMRNMVLACRSCNSAKGTKSSPQFMFQRRHQTRVFDRLKEIVKSGGAKVGQIFIVDGIDYRISAHGGKRWYYQYASAHGGKPGWISE